MIEYCWDNIFEELLFVHYEEGVSVRVPHNRYNAFIDKPCCAICSNIVTRIHDGSKYSDGGQTQSLVTGDTGKIAFWWN